jgi:hypothetical protein
MFCLNAYADTRLKTDLPRVFQPYSAGTKLTNQEDYASAFPMQTSGFADTDASA